MPTEIRFKRRLIVCWPLRLRYHNSGQRCIVLYSIVKAKLYCISPMYAHLLKAQQKHNTQWQASILITKNQSRQQSNRLRGQAFIRRGEFEIKHKNRCF